MLSRDRQAVPHGPAGTKSDEDALEGGLQPERGFSLARLGGAKAPRGLKPALQSVFNRAVLTKFS